jgi:hypothetical protein
MMASPGRKAAGAAPVGAVTPHAPAAVSARGASKFLSENFDPSSIALAIADPIQLKGKGKRRG